MTSLAKIDFTSRDYDTNIQLLKEYISSRAPESWNSFFEGDLGKMLMDVIAYDHAMLSYIIDAQTQECFIDTLRLRESLTHFARLTGYSIRHNSAASLEVYAQVSTPPSDGSSYRVKKGTKVTSSNGVTWEVAEDTYVDEGKYTPYKDINRHGDITATVYDSSGVAYSVGALVSIERGSSHAILTDYLGNRLSSEFTFSASVGEGHILKLGKMLNTLTSTVSTASFTSAPDATRDEFAITSIGKLYYDVYDRSVLYLDRPWDGATDFIGKWSIENRNIPLIQGETKTESYTSPSTDAGRKNWSVKSSFYPVVTERSETFIVSGVTALIRGDVDSGISVKVNGTIWEETPSLLFSSYDSEVFEVEFDQNDQITIKFGDGIFGKLVPSSAGVEVSYRVGGGKEGNVSQNLFSYSIQVAEEGGGGTTNAARTTSLFLSNPYTIGKGGQDRETIEEAKRNLVQFVRTNDRAVTAADYAYLASNFMSPKAGRVKFAKGVLHKNSVPREQNIVWVYTWVEGSNGQLVSPTLTLKTSLLEYLNQRKLICDEVVIIDGVTTNFPLRFFYKYSNSIPEDVMVERVASAINGVFKSLLPGDTVRISRLYEAIEAVTGVDYALFDTPSIDFTPKDEMTMLVNTLQPPQRTILIADCYKDQTSLVVEDGSIFDVGGVITLFQRGKEPTSANIEAISGSVVTLRPETPLKASYTVAGCEVLNSDYMPIGWQLDLPVDIYINYATTSSTSSQAITSNIVKKVKEYFNYRLLPSQILLKSALEGLLYTVNGVGSYRVNIGSVDSATEIVNPSSKERVILRSLVVNGKTY